MCICYPSTALTDRRVAFRSQIAQVLVFLMLRWPHLDKCLLSLSRRNGICFWDVQKTRRFSAGSCTYSPVFVSSAFLGNSLLSFIPPLAKIDLPAPESKQGVYNVDHANHFTPLNINYVERKPRLGKDGLHYRDVTKSLL